MKRRKEYRFSYDYAFPWSCGFFVDFIPKLHISSRFDAGNELYSGYRVFILTTAWLGFELRLFYRWFTD